MRVRWESWLFVLNQTARHGEGETGGRETGLGHGALEFDEHGRESNSNKAKTGFPNTLAPASGERFSLTTFFVRTKKVGRPSGAKSTFHDKQKESYSLQ
ncbi:MAG: hypothetical protein PVG75_12735 [Thioalkalispiraceae bacterium]